MFRCSGPDRSSCDSRVPVLLRLRDTAYSTTLLQYTAMASKAKPDVKVLKGQDGARLLHYLPITIPFTYSRTKAEHKVLDYVKRVRG